MNQSPYPPQQQMGFGNVGPPGGASTYPPAPFSYPPQQPAMQNPYPPQGVPQPGFGGPGYPPQGQFIQTTHYTMNQAGSGTPQIPTGASAPPPDFKGEILNFDPQIQPPTNPFFVPNFDDPVPIVPGQEPQYKAVDITIDEAKKGLDEYVSKKWCYGKADDITLEDVQMESVLKYHLTSCTELRKTQWKTEPFTGQPVSNPGPIPNAWEIPVTQETPMSSGEKEIEITGTASVRPCQGCWGSGRSKCTHCQGMGAANCTWCKGQGFKTTGTEREQCTSCTGIGRKQCTFCHGNGSSQCNQCKGRGSVYTYLQLIVKWELKSDEFITQPKKRTDGGEEVPTKKLSGCEGLKCFEDTRDRLYPLYQFPNPEIQKVIRIALVNYACKGERGSFYVYGENNKVFFPNYPHKGCCSII